MILFFSTLIKSNIMLLITGIMIGYITSSAISLLNFFATAEGVHSYMIWGMGNFSGVSLEQLPYFAAFTLAGLVLAIPQIMYECTPSAVAKKFNNEIAEEVI